MEDLDRLATLEDRINALANRKAIEDCVCGHKSGAEADLVRRILTGDEPATSSIGELPIDLRNGRVLEELTDFESTFVSNCKIDGSTATTESLRIGIYASLSDTRRYVIGLNLIDILELRLLNWTVISRHIRLHSCIVGVDMPSQTLIKQAIN